MNYKSNKNKHYKAKTIHKSLFGLMMTMVLFTLLFYGGCTTYNVEEVKNNRGYLRAKLIKEYDYEN